MAARSALRVRLIDVTRENGEPQRRFHIRTIAAVNELALAMHHATEHAQSKVKSAQQEADRRAALGLPPPNQTEREELTRLDPAPGERVVRATEEWRSVLAEGHYFAGPTVSEAMEAWDRQREVVITAYNTLRFDDAGTALAELLEYQGRQLYRQLQIAKMESSLALAQVLQEPRLGSYGRRWAGFLNGEMAKTEKSIEEADEEHRPSA